VCLCLLLSQIIESLSLAAILIRNLKDANQLAKCVFSFFSFTLVVDQKIGLQIAIKNK